MSEYDFSGQENSQPLPNGSFIDKVKEVASTAKEDFVASKWTGKLALGSMLTMTAYEWGPGNETTLPIIAGRAIDHAHSPSMILAATLITGTINTAQQLASGYLARQTVQQYPQTADKAYAIANRDESVDNFHPFTELSKSKKAMYSFFLGSSFNVMREAFVTKNKSPDNLKSVGRRSALITGGITSTIVAAAGTVDVYADNPVAQEAMSIAKNPLPWLAIGSTMLASDIIRSKLTRRKIASSSPR